MTAPTVEAAIHELMDHAWNVVYDLLEERGLLGDGLFVEEYTGIHSWVDDLTRYPLVRRPEKLLQYRKLGPGLREQRLVPTRVLSRRDSSLRTRAVSGRASATTL